MPFSIRFLGTSAARPTVERAVSAIALIREGETLLFDCGEGTQRQMMRYGISFGLDDIFITHTHSDHILGLTGLLRTLSLQGRTEPLRLWGPRGSAKVLRQCIELGGDRIGYTVNVTEIEAGAVLQRKDYDIATFPVDHRGVRAVGYRIAEHDRLGRFNPELARAMGVPEGPLWGRLHRGETVTLPDGREVSPESLVGGARRGRKVVLTGDTRPCEATIAAAWDADVLVHEATFSADEAERARETGHSTAEEAASVARAAGVRRLVLTHISARYSRDWGALEAEARAIFPVTTIARDGTEIVLPLTEELAAIESSAPPEDVDAPTADARAPR
ncbi:MAG TPA: ribonuclease Z [Gemmatimonadaceae bacterium]|nr:ribonuclease Z [Gemmatimonadaceae bacterium]